MDRRPRPPSAVCVDHGRGKAWLSRWQARGGALVAGVALAIAGPAAAFEANQHGLTGAWYNPVTSGQGLQVEVYQDIAGPGYGLLQAGWFTFDQGAQRWYTLSGPTYTGQSSVPLTIYQNVGGNFGAPPTTMAQAVGTALINFTACDQATLSYSFNDMRIGVEVLSRLTQNVSCVPAGNNEPSNLDFGLSGNYYDPMTSGQGIILELNNVSRVAFFTWYTYALNGVSLGVAGQRWLTAQGAYTPGARSVPLTLYETTGGLFNAPSTPPPVTAAVGTANVFFNTCQRLTLTYAFTGGSFAGRSGTNSMDRLGATPRYCF